MRVKIVALALLLSASGFFSPSYAMTIDSTVAGFARLSNGFGGTNSSTIEVQNRLNVDDHGVIEFDISTLTSSVTNATLNLFRNSTAGAGNSLSADIYGYVGDGLLSQADFGIGDLFVSNVTLSGTNTTSINVTSLINSLIGNTFAGINIRASLETTSSFYLADGQSQLSPPTLEFSINAVPVPAALPLFGTGLAFMGFIGWRRKRKLAAAA